MPGISGLFSPAFKRRARIASTRFGWHGRPDFLIVGAQKAGTTALYQYLLGHRQLVGSKVKETYFFSPESYRGWTHNPAYPFYERLKDEAFDPAPRPWALRWYHTQFPIPRPGRLGLNFEATPDYLYYPLSPRRIQAYRPEMKLIVLLRDPVERAYSAWNMFHQICEREFAQLRERRNFARVVEEELESIERTPLAVGTDYVRRGLYFDQLTRLLDYFPAQQVHVVHSRDLRHDTPSALKGICEFLGIDPLLGDDWPPVTVGQYDCDMPADVREQLTRFYAPHNKALFELLGRDFGWETCAGQPTYALTRPRIALRAAR